MFKKGTNTTNTDNSCKLSKLKPNSCQFSQHMNAIEHILIKYGLITFEQEGYIMIPPLQWHSCCIFCMLFISVNLDIRILQELVQYWNCAKNVRSTPMLFVMFISITLNVIVQYCKCTFIDALLSRIPVQSPLLPSYVQTVLSYLQFLKDHVFWISCFETKYRPRRHYVHCKWYCLL